MDAMVQTKFSENFQTIDTAETTAQTDSVVTYDKAAQTQDTPLYTPLVR